MRVSIGDINTCWADSDKRFFRGALQKCGALGGCPNLHHLGPLLNEQHSDICQRRCQVHRVPSANMTTWIICLSSDQVVSDLGGYSDCAIYRTHPQLRVVSLDLIAFLSTFSRNKQTSGGSKLLLVFALYC